jgi:hypothetical protein
VTLYISSIIAFIWRFPGVACLSLWLEEHVDEDEYGALVDWYLQGETKVLGDKRVPLLLCSLQLPMQCPGIEPRPLLLEASDSEANWGMAEPSEDNNLCILCC